MSIKLIIAESSDLFQAGIQAILRPDKSIEILSVTSRNQELIDKTKLFLPDVILIDYRSRNFSLDVISEIKAFNPTVNFLGITGENSTNVVMKGIKNGILGYVKKECSAKEIIDAIKDTATHKIFFCKELLKLLEREHIEIDTIFETATNFEPISLSDRESEVVKLIAEGYTNTQIAVVLYLSNHTVNTHRKNIMRKLNISNTAGIVMFAVKSGLVTPENYSNLPELED